MQYFTIIIGIIQIITLVLKNKFESDAQERKRKDELLSEWKDTVKSGDISRINGVIDRLRK